MLQSIKKIVCQSYKSFQVLILLVFLKKEKSSEIGCSIYSSQPLAPECEVAVWFSQMAKPFAKPPEVARHGVAEKKKEGGKDFCSRFKGTKKKCLHFIN